MRDIEDIEIGEQQVAVVLSRTRCCAEHGTETHVEAVVDNRDALREFVRERFVGRERAHAFVRVQRLRE